MKLAALLAGACIVAAGPAKAGLLDLLFGHPTPAPMPSYAPEPLDMTVRGHAAPKPRAKKDADQEMHAKRQTPIDPVSDPEWFLNDPTLRKGDIIVLADKVLVFNGGRDHSRARDFSDFLNSPLVSKVDREKIRTLTEAPREPLVRYQAVPASATFEATAGLSESATEPANDASADRAAAYLKKSSGAPEASGD